jgi:ABC-type branched-subunit amino acid transport system ATPase component
MSAHSAGAGARSALPLKVEGLNVARGEARVLFDIRLHLGANEIVSCVGRNGAGKSTLMKSIAGFLAAQSGQVFSEGASISGLPPYEIARRGVKYVPQDKKVFSDLTVRENLELGSYATQDHNWDPVLNFFPKLKVLMDRKAGFLSGGERQMLMIGRAILGGPKVLLIDEPTEGLAPSIVSHLKQVFTELSKSAAVLIVEQNLPLVCAISDRVYALKEGRLVAELTERDQMKPSVCENLL